MNPLPNDEIMKALSKLAFEEATATIAAAAREFSLNLPDEISGREALMAFADSIDRTNAKRYRKAGAA